MPRPSLLLLLAVTLAGCGLETRPNPSYHPAKDAGTSKDASGGKDGGRPPTGSGGMAGKGSTGGPDAGHAGKAGGAAGTAGSGGGAAGDAMRDGGAGTGASGPGGHGGQGGMDAGPCGAPCSDPASVCDTATGLCVECELSDDCKDINRPACDTTTQTCVQCTSKQDCAGTTAVCDTTAHACVQCLQQSDCGGSTPQCDTSAQTCVECLQSSDCGDPTKARCDAEVCRPCTADAQCTRLTSTPVCDEGRGACVQCTADTEAAQCGAKACKRAMGTCTTVDRGTATPCTSCAADSECVAGAKCVLAPFGTAMLGPYCFFDSNPNGCASTNAQARPYSQLLALTSIDGAMASYCLPPTSTTCKGIADATAQGVSGGKVCSMSGDCGDPNTSDGICGDSGPTLGKCTYGCQNTFDCPQNGFTTCNTVGTSRCE